MSGASGSAAASPLRTIIIGVGAGVFKMHQEALSAPTIEVVGVSDINPETGQARAKELGCAFYPEHQTMLRETSADLAVILAPHPFHAPLTVDCLEAGCHVLVEKPIAVQVAEADMMVDAAERTGRLLAVNFQQRHRADVHTAHKLIREGALGKIQHIDMTVAWPRTKRYFEMVSWRGTWAGEGGGVLMNQAPHNLDLICYLLDSPARVVAWTRTTLHEIETEDVVQAMMEWPNGVVGSLHISTAEAGRPERLEIIGTRGSLQLLEGGQLRYMRLEQDFREFMQENDNPFGKPSVHEEPVELEPGSGNHLAVYSDLVEAIVNGAALTCDGVEARKSLELANAMIYSSHTGSAVELPLDRQKYAELLADLKARHAATT